MASNGASGMSGPIAVSLHDITVRFGRLTALDSVAFDVPAGQHRAIIGPNGAGKSTLFGVVAGTHRPTSGRVIVDGDDITSLPVHRRADVGVITTFQHSSLFLRETVLENVLLAVARKARVAHRWFRPATAYREQLERSAELLAQVGLAGREALPAGALSHGERRQLEVGVALAAEPRVLLLDEPAAGMSPAETARLSELIRGLPAEMTVLLVEHDLDLVFDLAHEVTVLHLGQLLTTGSVAQVRANEDVQRAYLGAADVDELFFDREETR
ncbi:ATP-binding cassette domain-containing protein [Phytoactinopolyspora sp. XMNu-373]|uniref:ATP-binding cassette domain-containing protein n=2 Tax=Phytoactinopolyspora mesophila TaxID=2650750 RepID=A0A7K3M8T3_9ACTN|nr:ATP-binding cassette domain-containing protein [Phytoactinopolyspora mesophila]